MILYHGSFLETIVSRYEYDESREGELKTLKFEAYSEEWLDFILNCRRGKDLTDYDLVMGGGPTIRYLIL